MQKKIMNIKMIVSDLDNTLLRSDKTLSDRTKSVLQKCRESGVKTAYATARGGSAEHLTSGVVFDGKINMNGAVAKIGDEIIYARLIPYQTARPLLMACDKRGLKITAELNSIHYENEKMSFYNSHETQTPRKTVDFSQHRIDSEKIFVLDLTPEDVLFINNLIPESLYFVMARVDNKFDDNKFGMIMHRDATKSKAVAALAEYWGIKQAEIAAFGDDVNDIDMLKYCGVGVAVANAVDEVKAAADYICETSDNDGAAKWIEEFL